MNDFNKIECIHCGEKALEPVRKYRTDSSFGKKLFGRSSICSCKSCGLAQVAPVPPLQQLSDYYETDYRYGRRYGADVANVDEFPYDNLFYLNRGESIAELVSSQSSGDVNGNPLRILDVGAGFGHILHSFSKRFPDSKRFAIEISDVCVEHLRGLGTTVFSQPAEEALNSINEKFDIIILSHLFEHLRDPASFVRQLKEHLSPAGYLYIEVPNIPEESLTGYPDNKWAPRVDEPHITFFNANTLKNMLQRAGLDVQFCETAGAYYKNISAFHFHLPRLQPLILRKMPRGLFRTLRKMQATKPLRVHEREDSFYQYGGFRIWIRSISKLPKSPKS